LTRWYTYVAIAFATWFALTSWIWFNFFALLYSYPVGVLALILYLIGRNHNPSDTRNQKVFWILISGWLISIMAMLFF
jgi:hypothetical protein